MQCEQRERPGPPSSTPSLPKPAGGLLYRGNVLTRLNEDRDAFLWGTVHLTGTGEWQGISYKVWYKNENQMTWLDGEPHAMSPDIVTVIDPGNGIRPVELRRRGMGTRARSRRYRNPRPPLVAHQARTSYLPPGPMGFRLRLHPTRGHCGPGTH